MNKLLEGKNILITGAGRNIGRAIAIETAKQGANVFFTDIDKKPLNALEKELSQYPVQSKGFLSDISKTEDIDFLCQNLFELQPRIQLLCNNVGLTGNRAEKDDMNLSEWHNMFQANVFGPMYLTHQISKRMIDDRTAGSIIFMTSIHQWHVRRIASYSSSKAALGMIIKELAVDLAPFGIRVNGIAPGYVQEDENENPVPHRHTPLHKTSIKPVYIARAVIYLASDFFSKFTTGAVITIDAGLSLYNHLLEADG